MPIHLRADPALNRAYLSLTGLVGDAELRDGLERYITLVSGLSPGFTTVTELAGCRPLSQEGVAQVRRAARACVERGIRAAARVVSQTTVAMQQFQRVSHEEGHPAFTVATLEEAERMLDAAVGSASGRPALLREAHAGA